MGTERDYMAAKLKQLRKNSGLSAADVGVAVGKSDRTVSAWEVGHGQPDADILIKLCKLYNARISDFFSVDDELKITNDEKYLLMLYRSVDAKSKSAITTVAESLADLSKRLSASGG